MPNTFCETPDGDVLVADGFGPVLAWDGFSPQVVRAGVPAPAVGPALTFSGVGRIVGTYRAFMRYVDARDYPSNVTPIQAEVKVTGSTGAVTGATSTSPIVLTMPAHGLTGASLLKVEGTGGQPGAIGTWEIEVVDADRVRLLGSYTNGIYTGGGTWSAGVSTVTYTGLERPTDPRVRRRQILRNTDGQQKTFYVDVDAIDLSSTSLSSTNDDAALRTQQAVPFLDSDGRAVANVHGEPPSDKPYILYHQSRVWLAGEVKYTEGAVKVTFGSDVVRGIATEWRPEVKGRFLYVVDADKRYEIKGLDPDDRTRMLLTEPYLGRSQPYALYAIRSAQPDQRTVWYSDATHPTGFSPFNSLAIPDDGDELTGLLSADSFLYVLEHENIYKFTYQNDPALDGALFPQGDRGCVNQRCAVPASDGIYMLDEQGVHKFLTRDAGPVSTPVQTLFRLDEQVKINFDAARYFHAVLDPGEETVRWFVSLSGSYLPRHALCYQFSVNRWWIEEYPVPIGCSFRGLLYRKAPLITWGTGRPTAFYGMPGRRVAAFGTGRLDGVPAQPRFAGPVVAADMLSITGPDSLPALVVNTPVVITGGKGRGQRRQVVAVAGGRLSVRDPWLVLPDETSRFQIGGIPWVWKSGWLKWVDEESTNARAVEVQFEPNGAKGTVVLNQYRDRSEGPDECGQDRSEDGVTCRAESPDIELSLPDLPGGYAQALMAGGRQTYVRGRRSISVGLSGVGNDGPTRIYQVSIDGAVPPGQPVPDDNAAT